MRRYLRQQLLTPVSSVYQSLASGGRAAVLALGLFAGCALAPGSVLATDAEREHERIAAVEAVDALMQALEYSRSVIAAAVAGTQAPAPPPTDPTWRDFDAMLSDIERGETIVRPDTFRAPTDSVGSFPGNLSMARPLVSAFIATLSASAERLDDFGAEARFSTPVAGKIAHAANAAGSLVTERRRAADRFTQPYAAALRYRVEDIETRYLPHLVTLHTTATETSRMMARAVDELRLNSATLMARARDLLSRETNLLADEEVVQNQVAVTLSERAKVLMAERDDITVQRRQIADEIQNILDTEAQLADAARSFAQARSTGKAENGKAADAAAKDLQQYRAGMKGDLERLNSEEATLQERFTKNQADMTKLSDEAKIALEQYKTFERQKTEHEADEDRLNSLTF
jgi:hypothetical protein